MYSAPVGRVLLSKRWNSPFRAAPNPRATFACAATLSPSEIPGGSKRASVRCGANSRVSRGIPNFASRASISAASGAKFGDASIPAQKTRGRFPFGKNPNPRNSISTGLPKRTSASAARIASSLPLSTCPMNFNVTCRFSGRTQRARFFENDASAARNSLISAPKPSRTAEGISSATKSRRAQPLFTEDFVAA